MVQPDGTIGYKQRLIWLHKKGFGRFRQSRWCAGRSVWKCLGGHWNGYPDLRFGWPAPRYSKNAQWKGRQFLFRGAEFQHDLRHLRPQGTQKKGQVDRRPVMERTGTACSTEDLGFRR